MRWSPGDRGNIQDMRGSSGMRVGSIGIGGFLLLLILSWVTGTDFLSLFSGGGSQTQTSGTSGNVQSTPQEERMVDFVDAVAGDVQNSWGNLLGGRYERTQVVLFRDAIDSACGFAQAATGPFYCPRRSRCISTSDSSPSCRSGSARPAILRRPTSLRMNSVITFRT